jgi:O-methyltransferase involved in polyketide biosynthesis
MKNKTEFNAELSALMVKYGIELSMVVTEFKEGNNTFVKTSVFDTGKNKSRKNKLLKEASNLLQQTGLNYLNFKNINDFLEAHKLQSDISSLTRDLKEVALSQDDNKKLKSIRLNKENAVKAKQWELASRYRDDELKFLEYV